MSTLKYHLKLIIGNISINNAQFVYQLSTKGGILGQTILAIYRALLKICNLSMFPIENYVTYSKKVATYQLVTIDIDRVGVSSNIIMSDSDTEIKFYKSTLPDLLMLKSSNVNISGNSDVIVDVNNNCVISDASYNVASNVQVIDGLLYRTRNNVCILRDNLCKPQKHINSGIMMSGKFCNNYYHVLLENLIKLLYIEKLDIPTDVPIIMDSRTIKTPSLKRIYDLLTNNLKRSVITIDSDKIYHFSTLYSINCVNQIPSHLLDNHSAHSPYLYYPIAIKKLRDNLLPHCTNAKFPNKVFITRASTKRRNFNENEVFEVLQKYGFEKVAPELLTFEEQMTLFHNAEYIVAGSGAALTNLLFVTEKCTVICFGISNNGDEIPVFNTIANINGTKFIYFPRKSNGNGDVHSNFEIDCSKFDNFLQRTLNK